MSDFSNWKNMLETSHKKHKTIEKKIDKWRKYYRGDQWNDINSEGYNDKTVENMVFSNIRTIMPAINLNNPRIYCKPAKKPYMTKKGYFDTIGTSVVWEMLMNYYYRTLRMKREIDKAVNDALIGPWGFVQLGYTLETEKIKDDSLLEVHELIKSESVFCVRRSPKDIRFDIEATDHLLADARWTALKWVKPLDDVKRNPKYSNTKRLKANSWVKTDNFEKMDTAAYKPDEHNYGDFGDAAIWERVEGWDIWDKKKHRLMTYVKGHDKFLQEADWPLDIDGFPIEIIYFNENPDEVYPISDVEIYLSAQDELNRIHSLQLAHIKSVSQRRYLAQENSVDPEEMRKITHGGDGTVATVRGDPSTAIVPLRDATISQDIYIIQNGLKNTIREAAGISSFDKGITQKLDTANESALVGQGTAVLRQERLSTLEKFIVRVVKKASVIIQQTMDTHEVPLDEEQFKMAQQHTPDQLASIVGDAGEKMIMPWLTADKKSLHGDYDFEVEVGSTQPVNQDTRKRDAVQLYQIMAQNPYVKKREGTKFVLDAFNMMESDKFLKTDEEVQKAAMAANQQHIQTELALDTPKRQVDMAKTKLKTDTTLKVKAMETQGTTLEAQSAKEKHNMEMAKLAMETEAKAKQSQIKTAEMQGKARMNILQMALRNRGANKGGQE